jgi:four helix bundle protein
MFMAELYRTFEELPVWQTSRRLTRQVYAAVRQSTFRHDRGLVDQITRAAVSVMSNIAEGLERGSTSELIQFLFYAKGSVGEVRCQLYVAEDQEYISPVQADIMRQLARDISHQLDRWIKSLQTVDAAPGPSRRHLLSPVDKQLERQAAAAGYIRMPNGQFVKKDTQGTAGKP